MQASAAGGCRRVPTQALAVRSVGNASRFLRLTADHGEAIA